MDFARPPVRNTAARLDIGDGRSVLRIDVPVSERVHETNTGDAYLRVGDESKRLTYTQRRELDYDRGAVHLEGEPAADAMLNDLSRGPSAPTEPLSAVPLMTSPRFERAH